MLFPDIVAVISRLPEVTNKIVSQTTTKNMTIFTRDGLSVSTNFSSDGGLRIHTDRWFEEWMALSVMLLLYRLEGGMSQWNELNQSVYWKWPGNVKKLFSVLSGLKSYQSQTRLLLLLLFADKLPGYFSSVWSGPGWDRCSRAWNPALLLQIVRDLRPGGVVCFLTGFYGKERTVSGPK